MSRTGSIFRIFLRMLGYGIGLGAVAGFLVGVVLLLGNATDLSLQELLEGVVFLIFVSAIYGGLFGGIYGGASGFVSGLLMALVTAVAFREVRNRKRFRIVNGIITAVATGAVFTYGDLMSLEWGSYMRPSWTAAMVMSVVIAVYASQIVSRKYSNEIAVRKQKVEA